MSSEPQTEPFSEEPTTEEIELRERVRKETSDLTTVNWYDKTVEEALKILVQPKPKEGVRRVNVAHRRERFGSNNIPTGSGPSLLKIIFSNFVNTITMILTFVAVVSGVFEDWAALGICIFVIIFVGIIGVYQEWNAASSLESLKTMTKGTATVIRDGKADVIAIDDVVVGDVVVLEQGTSVPADMRVIDCTNLEIDEGLLTGEPIPVVKRTARIPKPEVAAGEKETDVPLGDRKNLAFRNTLVTNGRGKGVVYSVGVQTEMGKMAAALTSDDDDDGKTDLQRKMNNLMYVIFGFCLILVVVVFGVNEFNMTSSVILYGAAVAIAILPQSLVAVIAVAMAISVRKMASQKCIVRKLGSLEVLDRVTDICSDKTGTLTQNKMTVARILLGMDTKYVIGGAPLEVTATFQPEGSRKLIDMEEEQKTNRLAFEFFRSAALCGTTVLKCKDNKLEGTGNPTEIALQASAWKASAEREKWEREGYRGTGEFPFDSTIKRMSASYFNPETNESYICTKGAPERVLQLCKWKMTSGPDGTLEDLTAEDIKNINKAIEDFAELGLRTICLTRRNLEAAPMDMSNAKMNDFKRDEVESNLIYLGIVGIYDPPRPESKLSVNICHRAGITVRMLTGDHFATAAAIATEINILSKEEKHDKSKVISGPEFDVLTESELAAMDNLPVVVGRCSPQTKVRMIEELHRRGKVCAMTGDGFNDSPSIKAADIGCAMGSGTDVTKGVADFVITDDNFATIVKALAEGRRISLAITKFVTHLLCGNLAETIVLICGLWIMQDDQSVFILSPMEILWLNLFTSTPPAIGLSLDPAPEDILRVGPNFKGTFNLELLADTLVYGITLGACSLCSFIYVLYGPGDGPYHGKDCNESKGEGCEDIWTARATAFTLLYFGMLIHAYNVRFSRQSLFTMPKMDNPWLWGSFIFGIVTIIGMLYIPAIAHNVFVHEALDWHWGVIAIGLVIFVIVSEVYKLVKNAVDPKPVYELSTEEEEMEARLFANEAVVESAKESKDSRTLEEITKADLAESFHRQASFSTAI